MGCGSVTQRSVPASLAVYPETRTLLPDPVAASSSDAANRQLAFGEKTMTYDANGNLASIVEPSGMTILTWDARNRLIDLNGPGLIMPIST